MVSIRKHAVRPMDIEYRSRKGHTFFDIPTLPLLPKPAHRTANFVQTRIMKVPSSDIEQSARVPVPMTPSNYCRFPVLTKRAWLHQGEVYVVDDLELTSDDVMALIHEAKNKRRVRLEKAHAVAAMAEALAEPKRRRPIPQDVRILVWKRDGGRCVECDSQENLEFDHIIPVAMGGANTDRNLQLLCQDCNRRKGASLG